MRTQLFAAILTLCAAQTSLAGLFDEETAQQCDRECTEESEDSLGRIEDTDGTTWKQGADGAYRSEDGQECRWSTALGEWDCE